MRIALFLALAAVTTLARGDDEIAQWLIKINQAAYELDYRGTFVYVHEDQIEVMMVARKTERGAVRERIYSINGSPREIIRDEEQVWCFLPEKKIGVHQYRQVSKNSFPHIFSTHLSKLGDSYRITLGELSRIANRSVRLIRIRPTDVYRYGYDLWADQETGLLLKVSLMDTTSDYVEHYLFTDIQIGGHIADKDLAPMTPKEELIWLNTGPRRPPQSQNSAKWSAHTVPAGFMLSHRMNRKSSTQKTSVEHLVYSDGLAAVSVFAEQLPDSHTKPLNGASRMGAVNAFGTVIDKHQITVVGEVPPTTVKMIAMSVKRAE